MMARKRTWTRRAAMTLAFSGVLTALAGCGGGSKGGSSPTTRATAPTDTTRKRIQTLHDLALRSLLQSGFQTETMAVSRNGVFKAAPEVAMPDVGKFFGPMPTSAQFLPMPMLGAFLRRIVMVAPVMRNAAIARISHGNEIGRSDDIVGRPEPSPDGPPPPPLQNPSFYYDYFLGLWVQIDEAPGKATYWLWEDAEKTVPAGSIKTTFPTDLTIFPQVYQAEYEFREGFLKNSMGSSQSTLNADSSGSRSYQHSYGDGWSSKGEESWTGTGDYSWSSRTDIVFANSNTSITDVKWVENSGTFRSDGSGSNRYNTSEGYSGDYTYNADGSGRARITGPDPGLPVTITWDPYGNTIIQYADSSTERIPGWGGYYGGVISNLGPSTGIGFINHAGGANPRPPQELPPAAPGVWR